MRSVSRKAHFSVVLVDFCEAFRVSKWLSITK